MNSPLKAVVDHHVDRPGVEAPRGVQLTGTNSLIGLIALICSYSRCNRQAIASEQERLETDQNLLASIVFRRPGGSSEEPEPDPIPNSAVKLLSANGTMSQDLGE